ncbi:MAG: glycosyltransferase family 39 protein [Patescibacteria group bacterium]|jgi:hypothetical protein
MKKNILYNLLLAFIILVAFVILINVARGDSQTTDEGVHLFAGYTYLVKGDFRLDPEHPPFLKELSALPILTFSHLRTPIDGPNPLWDKASNYYYDSWQETRSMAVTFFYSLGNNVNKLLFWGRFPFIILTLILGWVTYFWANRLYGKKAGLLAAALILFMPNVLAHGHLIDTDLGVALFMFIATYFWGEYLKKPSWWGVTWVGLFSGLAFASKYTSVMLIPIFIILAIIKLFLDKNIKNWLKYFLGFIGLGVIGFLVVWATYGFSLMVPPPPIGSLSENIRLWTSYNYVPTFFDGIFSKIRPLLFPADFYKGFALITRHVVGGHGSYLLGHNSSTGWWYYFPVLIFYKTPLALFGLLGLAIIFFKKIRAKLIFDELILIVAPLAYLLMSINTRADLGVRHVLPIFPFLVVFAAKSINLVNFSKLKKIWELWLAVILILLIGWYFYSSLSAYPNYLSYFNEAAGGSSNGYKIATDSNLDWGQDLARIKAYVYDHPDEKFSLIYPWDGQPSLVYYGIDLPLVTPDETNVTGSVIVAATYAETGAYSWLWHYPYEEITPGVFVFHISEEG